MSTICLSMMRRTEKLRARLYVPYWILVVLLTAQTIAVCFTHCLTARLALSETLMLVIILSAKGFVCNENAAGVLRTSAIIAFEALMFVNFIHAAQMLIERHDKGVHLRGIYIGLTLIDIIIKLIMMCSRTLPHLSINSIFNLLLHFSAASATLVVAAIDFFTDPQGLILKADPLFTLVTSAILALIAFPAFIQSMPQLVGDIPSNFKVNEFKADINAKFCSTLCEHIHVYRRWPMHTFDAFLSVIHHCSTTEPDWEIAAQRNITRIQNEIRSVLTKAGARHVTVEPRITQQTKPSVEWRQCIHDECRNKSCC